MPGMRAPGASLGCCGAGCGAASSQPCPRMSLNKVTQGAMMKNMARYPGERIWLPDVYGNKYAALVPAVGAVLHEIMDAIFRKSEERREARSTKALESKMDEAFSYLTKKMETMNADSTKFQESIWSELQLLREDTEKKQAKKDEDLAKALESMMEKILQKNDERFLTMEQKIQKSQESTQRELQLIRSYVEESLGKKEEEIVRALESRMENLVQHLYQKIQNLEQDFQERKESHLREAHVPRADPLKEQGKKEEESRRDKELQLLFQKVENLEQDLQKSKEDTQCQLELLSKNLENKLAMKEEETVKALGSMMDKKFDQFFNKIQNLEGDLQKSQESTERQLQFLRTELEKNQGKVFENA